MRKLFLSSSFKDVADIFMNFVQEDLEGKTITFIPTASIPEKVKFYVGSAKKAFQKMGLIVDELELTEATTAEIVSKLQQNDYIYISGGNTFFLLEELRKTGADKIIIEQIDLGKLYIGESAGSMIVSPNIVVPNLGTYSALNVIDFYPIPHHTNFPFAKAVEKMISKYSSELDLYPISNSQAILVNGNDVRVESK